jgi:hypothetical protein
MNFVVFPALAVAEKFRDDISQDCGYPRMGVRATGGIHGPGGITTRHGEVRKHPVRNEWAHVDDDVVAARRARVPLPIGAVSRELDASWFAQ